MGVIARQSIKHSIVTLVAIAIGAINVLIIYPSCLTEGEIGLMQWLLSTSLLLVPFLSFGANSLSVRFYPNFKTEDKKNHGFLRLLLLIPFIGFSILIIGALLFWPFTQAFIEKQSSFALLILPLSFAMVYTSLMTEYTINFKRIVIPNILSNLFPKIMVPILAILYFFWHQRLDWFLIGLAVVYLLITIGVTGYIRSLGQLRLPKIDWEFISQPLRKQMKAYAFYGIAGRTSAQIAFSLDIFMLGLFFEDYDTTGIYAVAAFISNTIEAPKKSITNISMGVLSQAYAKDNKEEIKGIYYKSCINQFIAALFLFIGIIASIDFLFDLMPKGETFREGKMVIYILGLAKVFDALTGVNNEVIGLSKHFRFNFYSILFLSALNILLNLLFVYLYGMIGVAIATLISVSLYNTLKYVFILIKMKLQPFDYKIVLVLLFGLGCLGLTLLIPDSEFSFLNIIINSALIGMLYPLCIYFSKVSPDINAYIDMGLAKVGIK